MEIQDHRRERLRAWIEQEGGHAAAVRKFALTESQASYLSQVLNGYSIAEKSARSWEDRLHMPRGYLDDRDLRLESPRLLYSVAHPMSLPPSDDPPSKTWKEIMDKHLELPESFRCEMPDDALAPNTPRGTPVLFDTTDTAPRAGVGVLVEDAHGARYIRVFRPGIGGQWTAWARNENYPTLDSASNGLILLAVARHRMLDGAL